MKNLLPFMQGKKTYLVAIAMVVYAVLSMYLGKTTANDGVTMILQALGFAAVRNAVK